MSKTTAFIINGVLQDDSGVTISSLPAAGNTGQVLVKNSATSYDVSWTTIAGTGDMTKAAYDTSLTGNSVDNALSLGGVTAANYLKLNGVTQVAYGNYTLSGNTYSSGNLALRNSLGTGYTNTFTQANGPLPAVWTKGSSWYATNTTALSVVNNTATLTVTSGGDSLSYLNIGVISDGTIQADLTRGSGILIRYNTDGSGYMLLLSSDGTLYFNKLFAGSSDFVLYTRNSTLPTSGTYKVICTNGSFDIYENNIFLTTTTSTQYTSGYIAIYSQAVAGNSIGNLSFSLNNVAEYSTVYSDTSGLKYINPTGTVYGITNQVPVGGTAGQVLVKNTTTNYDATWTTLAASGNVTGPATSTALGIATFNNTTGTLLSAPMLSVTSTGALQTFGVGSGTILGNARGTGAVDLQVSRTAATQVASGNYSSISGGSNNQASGLGSVISGGASNTATGSYSIAMGQFANTTTTGQLAISAYKFTNNGDAQTSVYNLVATTTSATAVVMTADGLTATAQNSVILGLNQGKFLFIHVLARSVNGTNMAIWEIKVLVTRGSSGVAAPTIVGTPTNTLLFSVGTVTGWTVALSTTSTLFDMRFSATGVAATTIKWLAKIVATELTF